VSLLNQPVQTGNMISVQVGLNRSLEFRPVNPSLIADERSGSDRHAAKLAKLAQPPAARLKSSGTGHEQR
jgi:hypothetical protein